MTNAPRPLSIREMVNRLLDQGYTRTVKPIITAIARASGQGILAQRLTEFDDEAKRLAAAGLAMKASNPIFRALLADFTTTLTRNRALIDGLAVDVQGAGIQAAAVLTRQLAFSGLSEAAIAASGVVWNSPALDTIAQIVNYTNKPAWTAQLDAYETGIASTVQQIAVRGVAEGHNPVAIAREVRGAVEGLPAYRANTMMRTLQLTAYRRTSTINNVANADILAYSVRIATLDDRTCMSCIALHGTIIPIGETVDEHHGGRCIDVPTVQGSTRVIRSGEEWFNEQSAERQETMMGKAAYRAYQAGEISLSDFPHPYTDATFGGMIREASLKDMLGDGAKEFYTTREAA
jgi:hypothetical protein